MLLRRSPTPALGLSLLVILALVASFAIGPLPILGVLALAGTALLLSRPDWALGIAIAVPMAVEPEADWGPSAAPSKIYELIPGTKLDPVEALVLLALAAVILDRQTFRVPFRSPGIMAAPLGLLALALLSGAVTGHYDGAGPFALFNALRSSLLLLVVPLVVVQVVGRRVSLPQALGFVLGLAALKGALGLVALAAGETAGSVGDRPLTYYSAPANVLTMMGLLFGAAALVRRVRLERWMWLAMPLMFGSLLLSYRRSFWIATVLGLVMVGLFGAGRQSRRVGLPALVAVAIATFLTLGSGLGSGLVAPSGGPETGISGRLESLNPTSLSQSKDDRYRIGERRNVLADLKRSPLTGDGLGKGYTQRYPLSVEGITNDYVHFAALWWWMRTGFLGLLGYLAMIATAVWAGAKIFRRHPDARVRAAGLAAAAGFVGYAVAETTATFTGPDPRSSLLIGAVLGLLAVGYREAQVAQAQPGPETGDGPTRAAALR